MTALNRMQSPWVDQETLATSTVFVPVAAESPGGGRIRDKHDPPAGDLVTVRGLNKDVRLHRLAAQAWTAMVDAARADGIASPLLSPVSGYRSSALQAQLWKRAQDRYGSDEEARKWVAPPGTSAHESGRAIDLHLGTATDSRNVARQRQSRAHAWLVANAERFGFYPYDHEPWHWEYNPPATARVQYEPIGHELGATSAHANRLDLPTVPALAGHRGTGPALTLRWNDMVAAPAEIDVVVHLHGYSRPWLDLTRDIEPYSGLDLTPVDGAMGQGRLRPTLTLLPRGHFTGSKQANGPLYIYTFPALDGSDGRKDGLTRLMQFSLERFAGAVRGPIPRIGRLILTAHSGGGAPLLRMLRFHDPHEVHVFDALYWDPTSLADWARKHIRTDRAVLAADRSARPKSYMAVDRAALRVFHGTGTRKYSRRLLDSISTELDGDLEAWYRVEASPFGHWEIPRNYGWRTLAGAAGDFPRATRDPISRPGTLVERELETRRAPTPANTPASWTFDTYDVARASLRPCAHRVVAVAK